MKTRHMGRKGVSPLIATVLLIAFAVALGAVVMNWGRSYVQDVTDDTSRMDSELACSDASVSIPVINGDKKVCYNAVDAENPSIEIIINNDGKKVDGFQVSVIGTADVDNPEDLLDSPLDSAQAAKKSIPYNSNIGNPQQIKIIPKITVNGAEQFCTSSAETVNYIPPCA